MLAYSPKVTLLAAVMLLVGCNSIPNLCQGFTEAVEPARADYFARSRIYPIPPSIYSLAEKYKPQLVIHPQGQAPINFDDYLAATELVGPRTKTRQPTVDTDLTRLSYTEQCHSYLHPNQPNVVSQPPYPWYLQVFRGPPPGDEQQQEQWTYLKYNLIFDWSGLGVDMGGLANIGVTLLGGTTAKWHRLDVHTAVIIAVDEKGYQRAVTINQHNYVRTYVGGNDFVMTEPVRIAAAYRTNELYLDQGSSQAQKFPVVRFYDGVPYLISGESKPFFVAHDLVVGANAGGVQLPTKLVAIDPQHPLAGFSGLLAPPKRLWGSIYTGRDGPMGYDYYMLPTAVPLNRLAALGYWQEGDLALARTLRSRIAEIEGWQDEEGWLSLIQFMGDRLQTALLEQEALIGQESKRTIE